jgi:hypothetical protein
LKLINALVVAALVLFAAGVVHADDISGGDSRIVIVPGDPPPAPSCGGIQAIAGADGTIPDTDCQVTGSSVTSITFAVPTSEVLGGALSCSLNVGGVPLSLIGWGTSSSVITVAGVSADECTFTAPTTLSIGAWAVVAATGDAIPLGYIGSSKPYNDGDCDLDDFTLGIPVGCDIGISTPSGATIGNTQAFAADATVDLSGSGVTGLAVFPEPGTWVMLLLGLAPLAFLRRRALQR